MKIRYFLSVIFILSIGCSSRQSAPYPINPTYPAPFSNLPQDSRPAPNGSLYNEDGELFCDNRAHKVGDVLTVIVQERNTIQEDGKLELDKKSEMSTTAEADFFGGISKPLAFMDKLANIKGGRKSTHKGKTKYLKKSRINDRLAVIVNEVRPDGLLVVWGKRTVVIDGETKTMALTGLVNPDDIMDQNLLYSDRIALSSIFIQGRGTLSSATEPGLANKTFRWVMDMIWPF